MKKNNADIKNNTLDKLELGNMMNATADKYVDTTDLIRELKHSGLFRIDIATLQQLMAKYPEEPENVAIEAITECSFLCTYYTDLYNKIRKNEMNMDLLYIFIDILEQIEKGELDQHDGAVKVGELLKKIYIDSALKKADKLNDGKDGDGEKEVPSKKISYLEYKHKRKQIEESLNK